MRKPIKTKFGVIGSASFTSEPSKDLLNVITDMAEKAYIQTAKYFWQGEPVRIEFGAAYPEENKEKPLFWYNYECNWDFLQDKPIHDTRKIGMLPAIRIYYQDQKPFIISNHFGIGVNKLLKGGSPRHSHFSFADNVKFETIDELVSWGLKQSFKITEFDEEGFSNYEAKRNKWQKENFPEEYEEMEKFKNSFRSFNRK